MDLIKEVHSKIAEKELYEKYGIDINEVYGVAPADPMGGETRAQRQSGEQEWRQQVKTGRVQAPPEKFAGGPRGAQTAPEVGDTVIFPEGGMGRVAKNFMGKITVKGPQGNIVVNANELVGPGKGPGGEMTWAIRK